MHHGKLLLLLTVSLCWSRISSSRTRRHLVFNKGTKFFLRLNIKDDILDHSPSFARAIGYKMAWDLPDESNYKSLRTRMSRKHLYRGVEYLLERHDLNGTACLGKFICEAELTLKQKSGFLSRLFYLIFRPDKDDGRNVYDDMRQNCEDEMNLCPLSLISFMNVS